MNLMRVMEGDTLILMESSKKILSITEQQEENRVDVVLEGSLRSQTVHDFQDEMIALALYGLDLNLDFSKVTYLSSACAQALLMIQQKMDDMGKGSLVLTKVPAHIWEELESTGLSELLMIED